MNKIELSKKRNQIDTLVQSSNTLFTLILSAKYLKASQDGIILHAVKGYNKEEITDGFKYRMKSYLKYPKEILTLTSDYLEYLLMCNKGSNIYIFCAYKEIKVILDAYLNGKINKELLFN